MLLLTFITLCTFISLGYSFVVYTCPENQTDDKILLTKDAIMYNGIVGCENLNKIFTGRYHRHIIVLHFGNSKYSSLSENINHWSNCSVKTTVVNGRHNSSIDFNNICYGDKTIIVVALTTYSLDIFETDKTGYTCMWQDFGHSPQTDAMRKIISTCLTTVWISGNSNYTGCPIRLNSIGDSFNNSKNDIISSNGKLTLKIATVNYQPFAYPKLENDSIKYKGPVFSMVDKLAEKLNINYEVYPSIDGKYGNANSSGYWNGVIGMLTRKEVDVVAAALTITSSRYAVVDYTTPFHYELYGILIHKPKPANKWWNALSVFTPTVWFVIFLSSLVATVFCYVIHKWHSSPTAITHFDNFGFCFWYFTSSLVNQGSDREPISWPARNFLSFWWLYVMAIISVYSGLLVAMLSIEKTVLPFQNLAELAEVASKGIYKLCLVDSTAMHDAIKKEITSDYKLLNSVIKQHQTYVKNSNDDCMIDVLNNKDVAYLAERSQLDLFQMINCLTTPMIVITVPEQGGYMGIALQKGSPLVSILSLEIQKIVDAGLFQSWKDTTANLVNNNSFCVVPTPDDYANPVTDPLSLEEFGGIFVLVSIGFCISILVFCFELVILQKRGRTIVSRQLTSEN